MKSFKSNFKRLTAIFITIILLSSFCAQLISSSGGAVKISNITLDVRGAGLDADLYYPAYTLENDNLPAVVVSHGGAVAKGVMRGISEELSRRGFVVMNVNAYNSGVSEMPIVDDEIDGILDAVDYLRTLTYVDPTQICLVGHSGGSTRVSKAAIADCGSYNLNDLLINELYTTFGIHFTRSEIIENADALASKYLNADQLAHYSSVKEQISLHYNTRVKAVFCLGSTAKFVDALQTVTVAGYEVTRNYQFNFGLLNGDYDYRQFTANELAQTSWYISGDTVQTSTWFSINDLTASSNILGGFDDLSVGDSPELVTAFNNRTVRMVTSNPETHSKNFFSSASASDVVRFCTQATSYNRGNLLDSTTEPLVSSNSIWFLRAVLNCIAMFAMIGLVVSIAGIFIQSKFFSVCAAPAPQRPAFSKKRYWIASIINIVAVFGAIYICNNKFGPGNMLVPTSWFFPLTMAADFTISFVVFLGVFTLLLLAGIVIVEKRSTGDIGIMRLGLKMRFPAILKTLLLAFCIVAVAYCSLLIILGLFNQDYRFWAMSFTPLTPDTLAVALRYSLAFFPVFLVCSAMTNYTIRDNIPGWLDDTIAVVTGSAGVWICCLLNIIIAMVAFNGSYFADFTCTYSTVLFVPIIVFVNRRLYKVTNSIWLGGFVSALLFGWSFVAATGFTDVNVHVQTIIGNFFGA